MASRWLTILLTFGVAGASFADVDYLRDVKPVLEKRCGMCHGAVRQEGGLRLDTASLAKKGGESGPGIVAGKPAESLVLAAITGAAGVSKMPAEGAPLTGAEVDSVRRWIETGAAAPDEPIPADAREHWSFKPPRMPPLPENVAAPWNGNPIDAFLASDWAKKGLAPAEPADPQALLRRVYLDLVGLPPTPEEIEAFLADPSDRAYLAVVERLLASPRYGERWGRHWMDVWRYSDWYGWAEEARNSQRHIWHWRDWIIESINADKPYDQMVREMLAGDEIAPSDPDTLRATGYLARSWYKFNRSTWLQETIEHTGKAFLGLTVGCARCHSHMYDPISQREYYQFRAYFEPHDIRTDRVAGEPDVMKAGLPRVYDKELSPATYLFIRGEESRPVKDEALSPAVPTFLGSSAAIKAIPLPAAARVAGLDTNFRRTLTANAANDLAKATAAFEEAKSKNASPSLLDVLSKESFAAQSMSAALAAKLLADDARYADRPVAGSASLIQQATKAERDSRVATAVARVARAIWNRDQKKAANPKDSSLAGLEMKVAEAEKALAGVRAAKPTTDYSPIAEVYPATSTGRRLALAKWVTDRSNPLASRVAVNHLWMRHFGSPLVPTVFDFGRNGKPPINPELLDWLAVTFVESGWSMKAMHRMIVASRAYRMSSSEPGSPSAARDPDNRFLWRMNPRRMEAEVVRDGVLFAAGSLDLTMGGPEIDHKLGEKVARRSVYFRHASEKQMTFLKAFDVAGVNECYQRDETVAPHQALALVNSQLAKEQSRVLARKLSTSLASGGHWSDDAFIERSFLTVLSRRASAEELAACREFLTGQAARLAGGATLTPYAGEKPKLPPDAEPNARARENLIHVLFNHHDFVTIH